MSSKSSIEWTEQTWNPVTGCVKVSPGCKHCYAETLSKRLQAMGAVGYQHGFSTVSLLPERIHQPLKRKKPTVYFVNSMSDLFQDDVPFSFVDMVMDTISQTPRHTYQILTKRAERMQSYFKSKSVPDNAWLGVSVEDQEYGKPRIDVLRTINAKTKFLSIEPLLEDLGTVNLTNIQWVIVGGESGPKARPMEETWVLSVRDQCIQQNVDFFFKQWGSFGKDGTRRSKKENGRTLDGRLWDMMPELSLA
jgi:protein gp37